MKNKYGKLLICSLLAMTIASALGAFSVHAEPETEAPPAESSVAEQPEPSYEEPEPSYEDPEPSHEEPEPSYEEPEPSYEEPEPSYEEPEPSYEDPEPSYEDPEPSYEEPEPSYEEPEPSYYTEPSYEPDPPPYYDPYGGVSNYYEYDESYELPENKTSEISVEDTSVDTEEMTKKDWERLRRGTTEKQTTSKSEDAKDFEALKKNDNQGNDSWIYLIFGLAFVLLGTGLIAVVIILNTREKRNEQAEQAIAAHMALRPKGRLEDTLDQPLDFSGRK